MSDFELSVGITGVPQANAQLSQLGQGMQSAERQAQSFGQNARQAGEGLASAGRGAEAFGGSARQIASHVQGLTSLVANLAGQLGGQGGSLGGGAHLVSALAGVASQSLALGSVLGPGGAVVGAITGALLPALGAMRSGMDEAAAAAERSVHSLSELVATMQSASQAQVQYDRLQAGRGSSAEQVAFEQRTAERASLLQRALAGDAGAIHAVRRQGITGVSDDSSLLAGAGEALGIGPQLTEAERGLLTQLFDAAIRQSDQRHALAVEAITRDEERATATLDTATRRARGGGRGGGRGAASASAAERAATSPDLVAQMMRGQSATDADIADIGHSATQASIEAATQLAERHHQLAEASRSAAEEQRHLNDAARTAMDAFDNGYTASLDHVIEAYHRANEAARRAGGQMISQSQLMERSMVAVGNNISETFGGTLKGAFESSFSAFLDGSKSFSQAADDMAKSVIRSLVIESIVQAVTEGARAIADFASYHYDTGAEHLAAAAAWAAVGVVAGSVGAGVGAFGGGAHAAGGGGGGGAASYADASRTQAQQQQPTTTTINMYPGGFITQKDVQFALVTALNQAARSGYQASPNLIRSV